MDFSLSIKFIHNLFTFLEANQCDSMDMKHLYPTYSIKADRVVIQAYIKAGGKRLLNCQQYETQRYLHCWKHRKFEFSSDVNEVQP